MGGLSKKAFQLEAYRKEHGKAWIAVDAGNLLFESASVVSNKAQQEKITATGIVEAYELMGYDAVGIGRNDLTAGLSYLLELQKKSALTWLSANLVRVADNSPFFAPSLIRRRGDVTFGIIGITGNDLQSQLTADDGAKLLSWSEVLPSLVKDLAGRCDFVILLSSLGPQEDIQIARQIAGINLIVEADGGNGNKTPTNAGNTLITHSNKQGKHLGILQVNWQPSGEWQQQAQHTLLAQKQAILDRYNWQLKRIEARGNPAEQFKDAPDRLASYQRLAAKRDAIAREVKVLSEQAAANPGHRQPSTYTVSFVAMEKDSPDDLKVLALVEKIKSDIADLARKDGGVKSESSAAGLPLGGDPAESGYVGWKRCGGCHGEIVEKWQKTKHARAYDTLAEKGQQFNQDCLPCHVTGVVTGQEPYVLTLPEELLQVGCEACHGPGQVHAGNSSQPLLQPPDKTVCLRCHTPDQDDNFDYQQKSRLVH